MMIHNFFFFSKKRRTILTQKPITSYSLLIQAQNTVKVRMSILHPNVIWFGPFSKRSKQWAHWLPSPKVFITLHSMIKLSRAKISRRKLRRNQGGDSSSLFKTFTIHPASVSMSSLFTPSWIAAEISSLTAKNSFAQELPASRNLQPARRHLAALFLSTKPAPPIFEWASKAPSVFSLIHSAAGRDQHTWIELMTGCKGCIPSGWLIQVALIDDAQCLMGLFCIGVLDHLKTLISSSKESSFKQSSILSVSFQLLWTGFNHCWFIEHSWPSLLFNFSIFKWSSIMEPPTIFPVEIWNKRTTSYKMHHEI